MKNLNKKQKFFKLQGVPKRIKNKLKEKKGLDGLVVVVILIVAAAVIGVGVYNKSQKGIDDLSDKSFDKISTIFD